MSISSSEPFFFDFLRFDLVLTIGMVFSEMVSSRLRVLIIDHLIFLQKRHLQKANSRYLPIEVCSLVHDISTLTWRF